jgi:hypothetical protein
MDTDSHEAKLYDLVYHPNNTIIIYLEFFIIEDHNNKLIIVQCLGKFTKLN